MTIQQHATTQCANCGHLLSDPELMCINCGYPRITSTEHHQRKQTFQGPITPASIPAALSAVSIDTLLIAVSAFVYLLAPNTLGLILIATAALALITAQTITVLLTGYTLGIWASGLRMIVKDTGAPPGKRLTGWKLVKVRNAIDPIEPYWQLGSTETTDPSHNFVAQTISESHAEIAVNQALNPSGNYGHNIQQSEFADAVTSQGYLDPAPSNWAITSIRQSRHILRIDNSMSYLMTSLMVIGRNPYAETGATVISIPDFERELSRTHLYIQQNSDGLIFVTDAGSANGTKVGSEMLSPNIPRVLSPGEIITIGKHTLTIETKNPLEGHGLAQ